MKRLGLAIGFLGIAAGACGRAEAAEVPAVRWTVAGKEASAVRGLGKDVALFVRRGGARLEGFSELKHPGLEVASTNLSLARPVMALWKAAGVPIDPDAADLMTLVGPRQLAETFGGTSPVRLLVVRLPGDKAAANAEVAAIERAGGVRLNVGERGRVEGAEDGAVKDKQGAIAATASEDAKGAAADDKTTSFGALRSVDRGPTARARHFEATHVSVDSKRARAGHDFVTLHIDRNLAIGVGRVSFLYGSGIIFEPAFERLVIEADGKRVVPTAIFNEGRTLELSYEVPLGAKRFVLVDGDARLPIAPVAAAAPPAG